MQKHPYQELESLLNNREAFSWVGTRERATPEPIFSLVYVVWRMAIIAAETDSADAEASIPGTRKPPE